MPAEVLAALLKADPRDPALLLLAFASGGRRRSEVSAWRVENIGLAGSGPGRSRQGDGDTLLPCVRIHLGCTKTSEADEDAFVLLVGPTLLALQAWLARSTNRSAKPRVITTTPNANSAGRRGSSPGPQPLRSPKADASRHHFGFSRLRRKASDT
jgi:hypothetical protein